MWIPAQINQLDRDIHRLEVKLARLRGERDRLEAGDTDRLRQQVRLIREKHAGGFCITHDQRG
jgi:hypothetical protein